MNKIKFVRDRETSRAQLLLDSYASYLNNFLWQLTGTLTVPFKISNNAIQNAIKRMCNMTENEFGEHRMFWAIEKHSISSYHVHFLYTNACPSNETKRISSAILENWQKALGTARKPNTRVKKCKNKEQAIRYLIKTLPYRNPYYGFEGDYWEENS